MDLGKLAKMPPWQWPDEATAMLLGILTNTSASPNERLLAAEMAGERWSAQGSATAAFIAAAGIAVAALSWWGVRRGEWWAAPNSDEHHVCAIAL